MASVHLKELPGVEFIAGRIFIYKGESYEPGDTVDPDVIDDLEVLTRSRHIIAVVPSESDVPRTFPRLVVPRALAFHRLGRVDPKADDQEEGGWDPADYTIPEVIQYVTDNPEELLRIIEAEESGKNRSTLLAQLYELIPEDTEVEADAPTQVENDVTIPVVEGVEYKVGGGVVTGVVAITEDTTVTAHPLEGYVLVGTTSWVFTYAEPTEPEPEE